MRSFLKRLLGPHVDLLFVSMSAAISFAFLDSVLRMHEPYTTTLVRTVLLQMLIYTVWRLPWIVASPFLLWTHGQVAYARWKATKAMPWLVAALSKEQPNPTRREELLAAAGEVAEPAPAYATTSFYRAKLLTHEGNKDEAPAG